MIKKIVYNMQKGEKMSAELKMKVSIAKKGCHPVKVYEKECAYCSKIFNAYHKTKKSYCSTSCRNKERYHNGEYGENRKAIIKDNIHKRNESIGNCALCGVNYKDIKTMKELGSNVYNGGTYFMKDHIIPKSQGGTFDKENIRYLCWFCNLTRKDMSMLYDEAIKKAAMIFWASIKSINN